MILTDNISYLLHLIRFGISAFWLDIQDFLHTNFSKNVVIASDPFVKSKLPQTLAQSNKRNVSIGCATH